MPDDIRVGDVVQFRKTHPCGSDQWQVYRIGADIGVQCIRCGRRVLLPRREFAKAVRKWLQHGPPPPPPKDPA